MANKQYNLAELFDYDIESTNAVYVKADTSGLLDCLKPTDLLTTLIGRSMDEDEVLTMEIDNTITLPNNLTLNINPLTH